MPEDLVFCEICGTNQEVIESVSQQFGHSDLIGEEFSENQSQGTAKSQTNSKLKGAWVMCIMGIVAVIVGMVFVIPALLVSFGTFSSIMYFLFLVLPGVALTVIGALWIKKQKKM